MKTNKFNLNLFKNGNKAQTKIGNPVRFVTISRDKLVVIVKPRWREDKQEFYQLDGKKYKGTETDYDLEMVESYEI